FCPINKTTDSKSLVNNLLFNTIENFKVTDKVFCVSPKSCAFENMFDEATPPDISKIIENIGVPIINIDPKLYYDLKKSYKNYAELNDLTMIPLSDEAFEMILPQEQNNFELNQN
ncbi:23815_t:CDS:2, partial [Gigaspora rosea]